MINKEGHKVLGYKTIKKCDSDASKKFIASKNMGHFVIFVICLIISNMISNVKYIQKSTKLAKGRVQQKIKKNHGIFHNGSWRPNPPLDMEKNKVIFSETRPFFSMKKFSMSKIDF